MYLDGHKFDMAANDLEWDRTGEEIHLLVPMLAKHPANGESS